MNKSVGIWIRVSTEDQAKGESPEHHEDRARSYAKSRGWEVKELYNLAGQSGKAVMDHPEAIRMMADIKRGHITGLVFSKLARLSRNRHELEYFSDFFKEHNADLVSLSEAIDTSTAGGRMFFHLLGVFAQWEREELTERVNASVLTRAKLGKSINGSAPYGYQWKDRKLVIKPEEAVIRKKAFELFLQHRRKGKVANLLNAAGHRTRNGRLWHDSQVYRLLTCTSAKGVYYFNRMRQLEKSWQTAPKPESEWGKVECEPIISEDQWNTVNKIIEDHIAGWKRPGPSPVHLFGGLAQCACGAKMYVRAHSSKYVCRKCGNKIPIVNLESIFHQEMKDFFARPERIAKHRQAADQNLAEKSAVLEIQQREIQKVRDEMHQTHQLYLHKQISGDGFRDLYGPAEVRLKQMQIDLPKLEAEVDFLRVNKLSSDDVLHEASTLYDRWPKLPLENQRKIAESLVEKIVIGDDEIEIKLYYLPTSEEACRSQQGLRPG